MRKYKEKLERRISLTGSKLCVGLDPRIKEKDSLSNLENFLFSVVDETQDLAAAFKPNIAYFEALGSRGIALLERLLKRIPDGHLVILDAKRSDIATTQEYYARACFETWGVDAVTLNPFLGYDSIEPFLHFLGKGIYLLALTSNAGSADFQMKKIEGVSVFSLVAQMAYRAKEENSKTDVGLVIGLGKKNASAWHSFDFENLPLLLPGLGAQGGDLSQYVDFPKARQALVNVSRGILYGDEGFSFYERAKGFHAKIAGFSEDS